jgi:hypothetical protein
MPAAIKFHQFAADRLAGVYENLATDTLKVALTNVEPDAMTDAVFGDLTEIAAGNGYPAGGYDIEAVYDLTAGVITITGSDTAVTAAGGSMAAWRYVVLYNDTVALPAKPLMQYWDRGDAVELGDGQSVLLDLVDDDKILTIS